MTIPPIGPAIQGYLRERPGLIVVSGGKSPEVSVEHRFWPQGFRFRLTEEQFSVCGQRLDDDYRKICSFLRAEKSAGSRTKKEALRAAADKHCGCAIPVREFDRAYKEVFNRKRGRPRS